MTLLWNSRTESRIGQRRLDSLEASPNRFVADRASLGQQGPASLQAKRGRPVINFEKTF